MLLQDPHTGRASRPCDSGAVKERRAIGRSVVAAVLGLGLGSLALRAHGVAGEAHGSVFYDNFQAMQLVDQNGRAVRWHGLLGKAVLFHFFFSACASVCPMQTQLLRQMQQRLAPELRSRVHLVSVSLDPLSDTPSTLKALADRLKADARNWSFVTGRPEDIYRLAETLWLFRNGKGNAPLEEHNSSVWLVNMDGSLRARYAGDAQAMAGLERELGVMARSGRPSG